MIYWKNFIQDDRRTYVKVFKQFRRGYFQEYLAHSLNGMELMANTQPFFLDLDGDMR